MTLSRTQALELIARHGLSPSRALGQNFVVDPNTVRRIARMAGVEPGDHIVEIGPGLGSLTLALVERGAEVVAVELDRHVLPALREATAGTDVRIIEADALELDWSSTLGDEPHWLLVANLPYNIATPLVLDLLDGVPQVTRMLIMVQREVAERLAATPGSRTYGLPSVKVAYWATASVVGRVPPTVFVPKPRVESALVRIVRRSTPATAADPDRLFALARAGFGQRRKMLRRSLGGLIDPAAFEAAGVSPEARAEQLSVQDWGRLAAQS